MKFSFLKLICCEEQVTRGSFWDSLGNSLETFANVGNVLEMWGNI